MRAGEVPIPVSGWLWGPGPATAHSIVHNRQWLGSLKGSKTRVASIDETFRPSGNVTPDRSGRWEPVKSSSDSFTTRSLHSAIRNTTGVPCVQLYFLSPCPQITLQYTIHSISFGIEVAKCKWSSRARIGVWNLQWQLRGFTKYHSPITVLYLRLGVCYEMAISWLCIDASQPPDKKHAIFGLKAVHIYMIHS